MDLPNQFLQTWISIRAILGMPATYAHNEKGGYRIDHKDHREIFHPESLEKGRFGKNVEEDIGRAGKKKEGRCPQEEAYFILIDLKPLGQNL